MPAIAPILKPPRQMGALQPVAWDALVPLGHWSGDWVEVPPAVAQDRAERLALYLRLRQGDFSDVLEDDAQLVTVNWYRATSRFLTDLLLTSGPYVQGDTGLGPGALEAAAAAAAYNYFSLGTGLFVAGGDAGAPTLTSPSPESWYPAGGGADVLVTPISSALPDGTPLARVMVLDPAAPRTDVRLANPYGPLALGAVVTSQAWAPWQGRRVFPIRRNPSHRNWGESPYEDMVLPVNELCRRLSGVSRTATQHGEPILTAVPDPTFNPPPSHQEEDERQARAAEMARWRGEPVNTLQTGWKAVEYVSFDFQGQGISAHQQMVLNSLLATTGVPAALWGIVVGGTVTSGVALRRIYLGTWSALQHAIAEIGVQLGMAIVAARLAAGLPPAAFSVSWPNPLDLIDAADAGASSGSEGA